MVVKPKRGTAVMWYSHFVDEQVSFKGKIKLLKYLMFTALHVV